MTDEAAGISRVRRSPGRGVLALFLIGVALELLATAMTYTYGRGNAIDELLVFFASWFFLGSVIAVFRSFGRVGFLVPTAAFLFIFSTFLDLTGNIEALDAWPILGGDDPRNRVLETATFASGLILVLGSFVRAAFQAHNARLDLAERHAALLREVGERERAERLRVRLEKAIEQVADVIFVTTPDGLIEYVNPAFERVTGYAVDEAIGRHVEELLRSEETPEEVHQGVWETIGDGRVWHGHFINRRKDGSTYNAECTISPVRDGEGSIVSYVAVQRDVTRELELESQLQHAQKMQAIGTLAGGIAHEFRNILSSMLGWVELATAQVPPDSVTYGYLTRATQAGRRASGHVKQLLTFSRRAAIERKSMAMPYVVEDALKLLRGSLPSTIELERDIDPSCGFVCGDPTQIHQVIMNLGSNAFDAIDEEGVIRVSLSRTEIGPESPLPHPDLKPGSYVLLAVSDNGRGMSEVTLGKIFEPFFTTKEPDKGTGLGLSTVHGIVQNHEGAITVHSKLGKGSTFTLYLPACPDEGVPDEVVDDSPGAVEGDERILLVDDDETYVAMSAIGLRSFGYAVAAHTDSHAAFEAFLANPDDFDVVITDQIMPRMTGLELAGRIRKACPGLPIVLVSGFSERIDREKIEEAGIQSSVVKPATPRDLARAVRRVLTPENASQAPAQT